MAEKQISRRLLFALIFSAEYLQKQAYSEEEIFKGFRTQLDRFKLRGGIAFFDSSGEFLILPQELFTEIVLPSLRKEIDWGTVPFLYDWKKTPAFRDCILQKQPLFLPSTNPIIENAFPPSLQAKVTQTLRHIPDEPGVIVPLTIEGEIFGILMLGGKGISKRDLPLITSFGNQVATAIQNARLFAKIRQAESRYRDLVENINEIIYTMDPEGHFTFVSSRSLFVLGYKPEEVIGRPFQNFVVPDDLPTLIVKYASILKGTLEPSEYRIYRKDGSVRWVRSSSRPIQENGRIIGVRGILTDIHDYKKAEEAFWKTEQEKTLILDNVQDFIIYHNLDMRILWANRAVENSFTESPVGKHCFQVFENRNTACVHCPLPDILNDGEPHEAEVIAGNGAHWLIRGFPVKNEKGKLLGIVEVSQDISVKKRIESQTREYSEAIEQKNLELTNRNKELDEFTYIASHDLQEPLNKISAFSELLKKDAGDSLADSAKKDLHFILNAVKRMRILIQDLLRLSRTGKSAIKIGLVDLNQLTAKVIDTFAPQIDSTETRFIKMPLPELSGDATLLFQLYQNLISNALKFHGAEPLVIELTAEARNNCWILGVRDNGIGIRSEFFGKIFIPF
ncbi:MAG: hypothetical protein A2293_15605, partial [Elusimicrobia bacterium RIFOXYB2_FULL_49_7]